MAEFVLNDAYSPSDSTASKPGRYSNFNAEEDLVLLLEVACTNDHVSYFGETRKRYYEAETKIKVNPSFTQKVT